MKTKNNFFVLTLVLGLSIILCTNCSFQERIAKLTFDQKKINLGEINLKDSNIVRINKITNLGNEKLIVFASKTSCDCTVVNFDYTNPIKPGETRNINIQFSPQDTGALKIPIIFRSNDPEVFSTFYLIGHVVEP